MNEHEHFKRFKGLHRDSMALAAKVETPIFTKSNGNGISSAAEVLQEALHLPRESFWNRHFKWEKNLTVAGRVIEKGWVVPQPLGIALLLVILGGVGALYWRIIDKQAETDKAATARYMEQREMLIRLDQRLIDKDTHDREKQQEVQQQLGSIEAWQQVTNKEIVALKVSRGN